MGQWMICNLGLVPAFCMCIQLRIITCILVLYFQSPSHDTDLLQVLSYENNLVIYIHLLFKQAVSLKLHLKSKHPGSNSCYACSKCPYRSVSKHLFANHMRDHDMGLIDEVSRVLHTTGSQLQLLTIEVILLLCIYH